MDLILAAVLASMEADKAVAEAIKDSSCLECRQFMAKVNQSVNDCKSCAVTTTKNIRERLLKTKSFRIRSKGGCCGS